MIFTNTLGALRAPSAVALLGLSLVACGGGGADTASSGAGSAGKAASSPSDDFGALFETIKDEASAEELYRFLYDLPKGADLHNHLGGSNRPE